MSRKLALILACGASLFSFGVQASPVLFAPMQKAAPDIMLVRDWCGPSGSVACSNCAISGGCRSGGAGGGCPDCVPLRLRPWSVRPLLAVLNALSRHLT